MNEGEYFFTQPLHPSPARCQFADTHKKPDEMLRRWGRGGGDQLDMDGHPVQGGVSFTTVPLTVFVPFVAKKYFKELFPGLRWIFFRTPNFITNQGIKINSLYGRHTFLKT